MCSNVCANDTNNNDNDPRLRRRLIIGQLCLRSGIANDDDYDAITQKLFQWAITIMAQIVITIDIKGCEKAKPSLAWLNDRSSNKACI